MTHAAITTGKIPMIANANIVPIVIVVDASESSPLIEEEVGGAAAGETISWNTFSLESILLLQLFALAIPASYSYRILAYAINRLLKNYHPMEGLLDWCELCERVDSNKEEANFLYTPSGVSLHPKIVGCQTFCMSKESSCCC